MCKWINICAGLVRELSKGKFKKQLLCHSAQNFIKGKKVEKRKIRECLNARLIQITTFASVLITFFLTRQPEVHHRTRANVRTPCHYALPPTAGESPLRTSSLWQPTLLNHKQNILTIKEIFIDKMNLSFLTQSFKKYN